MKKYIRFIAVFATLVLGFSVYKKEDSNVYAIELENKIGLLIENKEDVYKRQNFRSLDVWLTYI